MLKITEYSSRGYRLRWKTPKTLTVTLFLFLIAYLLWTSPISVSTSPDLLPDDQAQLGHQLSVGIRRFDANQEAPRENYIDNADEIYKPLQAAHDGFTQDMSVLADNRIYQAYQSGTKGIVSAAGGRYLPTFVVTLRILRRTGSTLPVELFLRDYLEYEPYVCEVVLPRLNARCIVLSEILPVENDNSHYSIKHYQIKSFAILFSSFETVIWMDADCIPLHNPAQLLTSKPFTSTGLVTWPDFWANTASPLYFQISRQAEPSTTARQSTEAGVLLISKKTHWRTLLLAAYYNYYGPSFYYPLLGQGGPGEGDKDTFLQAATAVGENFYTVSEPVADLGHPDESGRGIIGAAMLQADPIEDYALTSQGKWRVKDPSVAEPVRGFFVHAYGPKFNAAEDILGEKAHYKGNPSRVWTAGKDASILAGYDAEKAAWEEAKTVACTLEHAFDTWKDKSGVCERMRRHWEAVFAP
ncbi:hypothetical protein EYZ11_012420 [Aspergillus tanneri]|uniref:Alpha-1,2-mannosyltransferase (Mnn2) n=1 Tax=Aspergillus tanneri TaxID=1220188 RepID=A0A4S3J0V4_9EURO|nr:hypothetical protein EYZ11_012420 [Aspergillus tanneri]